MNEIISLFIDDEMNVVDKISFIERVRNNSSFADETLDLCVWKNSFVPM